MQQGSGASNCVIFCFMLILFLSVCLGCHHKVPWGVREGLDNRNLFSDSLEAKSPKSRCLQGWFLVRPLCLWCGLPSSHCVLLTGLFLCVVGERERKREGERWICSLFLKNSSPIRPQVTTVTSLLNTLCLSSVTLRPRASPVWRGGTQFSP